MKDTNTNVVYATGPRAICINCGNCALLVGNITYCLDCGERHIGGYPCTVTNTTKSNTDHSSVT